MSQRRSNQYCRPKINQVLNYHALKLRLSNAYQKGETMKRLHNEHGRKLALKGARYRVDCELDESVYMIGVNLFLYIQSGRYYLATTSDINALQWRKRLVYGGY